jgi:peptide/nickel transport system permease protein
MKPREGQAVMLTAADEQWIQSPRAGRLDKLASIGRALRTPAVGIPGGLFLLIAFGCFLGPPLFHLSDPNTGDLYNSLAGMGSPGHPLGTNDLGNDVLSRLLHGGRVSIIVGLGATGLSFVVGTLLGVLAAFLGSNGGVVGTATEAAILRVFDTLFAFPSLILALVIAEYLGPSVRNSIIAISVFGVARFGRLAWSETLMVRHRDYVTSARIGGARASRVIGGHLLPNVLPTLFAFALFTVGSAMMIEAGLSYLGLGVKQPNPTWGNMISAGGDHLSTTPSLLLIPGAALILTVLCLNLLADGLREHLAVDH